MSHTIVGLHERNASCGCSTVANPSNFSPSRALLKAKRKGIDPDRLKQLDVLSLGDEDSPDCDAGVASAEVSAVLQTQVPVFGWFKARPHFFTIGD